MDDVRKKSFKELMLDISDAEENVISLTNEELSALFGDLKDKVDNLREWDNKLKWDIDRIAVDIATLSARKQAMVAAQKRFREYLYYVMSSNETPLIKGNTWDLKIKRRKELKVTDAEPTLDELHLLNLDKENPVVKQQLSWNKKNLKEAYKLNPETYKDYVTEVVNEHIGFSATKPVK